MFLLRNKLNKFVDDTAYKYVKELKMPWFDRISRLFSCKI